MGILNGATRKRSAGAITEEQEREIGGIVELAETRDFRPLLYVIPYTNVLSIVQNVPVKEKAHPLAEEYVIEELPRQCFDIIELQRA